MSDAMKPSERPEMAMKPPPGHKPGEVLHQTGKLPKCPIKMALGGFAVVVAIGYLTLCSHKKPEASLLDVAKVATGTASPENTRPRT
ncbi:hypothetical protein RJ641_027684 [Dillenia turbinata]|uniref:Uncharacterized protein n=1 Tax=Dillenia turbinata TaxID=194707 RepID=A0AAN8W632_9MAGN